MVTSGGQRPASTKSARNRAVTVARSTSSLNSLLRVFSQAPGRTCAKGTSWVEIAFALKEQELVPARVISD